MDSYTLADLERVTGAKRRSLQLWADAGVIEPERGTNRAGTGTHRQFSRKQAIVACIIRGFAERQMAIGELLSIADEMRDWLRKDRAMKVIESTINGTEDWMLILETWVDVTWWKKRERSQLVAARVTARTLANRFEAIATGNDETLGSELTASLRAAADRLRPTAEGPRDRRYNFRLVEIRTNKAGEAVVLMPIAFFDKPEALAQSLRLRTYLSQMDVE